MPRLKLRVEVHYHAEQDNSDDDRAAARLPDPRRRAPPQILCVDFPYHAQQDNSDDDRAADRITQHNRDGAGSQENQNKRIGKKTQKSDQRREARLSYQTVRSMEMQSLFRLGGSQSGWSCFEQLE